MVTCLHTVDPCALCAALQFAKLSGFSPIITTASARNEAYCKTAGATHLIDYHDVPYSDLPEAVGKISHSPIAFVFDAISVPETQRAGWKTLGSGGNMTIVLPPDAALGKPGVPGADGKTFGFVYGNVNFEPSQGFGSKMYAALTELLETGALKVRALGVIFNRGSHFRCLAKQRGNRAERARGYSSQLEEGCERGEWRQAGRSPAGEPLVIFTGTTVVRHACLPIRNANLWCDGICRNRTCALSI